MKDYKTILTSRPRNTISILQWWISASPHWNLTTESCSLAAGLLATLPLKSWMTKTTTARLIFSLVGLSFILYWPGIFRFTGILIEKSWWEIWKEMSISILRSIRSVFPKTVWIFYFFWGFILKIFLGEFIWVNFSLFFLNWENFHQT